MPTITVFVPEAMKVRLGKHSEAFNVSAVCQRALDAELTVHETLKGKKKMSMVERLQVQAESAVEEARSEGRQEGVKWARDDADFETLTMFKDWEESNNSGHRWPDIEEVIEDQANFFYEEYKHGMFFTERLEGFVAGAVEAFNEALPEIGGKK